MQFDPAGFKELGKIKSKSNSNQDIELIMEGQNFYIKKYGMSAKEGILLLKNR